MTFRFTGFGKSLSSFGQNSGGFGDKSGLFGGKGGLFGDRDCGDDKSHGHDSHHNNTDHHADNGSDHGANSGSGSGGTAAGTGWPQIPSDTANITFTVDYDADGTTDNYIPVGRDDSLTSFKDYLAVARDQVATDNPDADPKDAIVKATITTQSGSETYYHFTGLEEGDDQSGHSDDNDKDDNDDASCGNGNNHGHHGSSSHGPDRDNDHDDNAHHGGGRDHDEDRSCGDRAADFFKSLMGHSGKSFDCNSNHDDWENEVDSDDEDEDASDICATI